MSSSIDLPSIQTKFSPCLSSASPSSSRPYHTSSSSSSPSPIMNYPPRSYSMPSLSSRLSSSSLHSQYSSSSDRSLSCSPGPSTPSDMMSRSPSFSHERLHKPLMTVPMKHLMSAPLSSVLPQPKGYSSQPSHLQQHHHAYHQSAHHHPYVSIPHPSLSRQQQYQGQALPSPRDVFSPSASRDHTYDHRESQYHVRGDRSSYGGAGDYFSRPTSTSSYHHLPTPTTPTAMESRIHPHSLTPLTPLQVSTGHMHSTPYGSPRSTTGRAMMMDDEYSPSMSRSPSVSSDRSSFSPEPSPSPSDNGYMGLSRSGLASPASTSMSSLSASLSSNNSSSASLASSSSGSSNPQLLLCPVCSRAFKPSKNQNCNLRRHLKNVHDMSPTMHPRKCKWDSLPDGRVKDDKDRKERTRKSKRLWARKFRLRRKVEEAAVVLSMLSQAL